MTIVSIVTIRPILTTDAATLADIHIASWRSAYRGMLRDEYLDTGIVPDRRSTWNGLLQNLAPSHFGFIAEVDGKPAGFVFLRGADDGVWGNAPGQHSRPARTEGHGAGPRAERSRQTLLRTSGRP